jgi:biotin carboxyl carrier protein
VTKKVTVIVEGCKYVVEVGDLKERPIKATVNQKTYQVMLPASGSADESAASDMVPTFQEEDCAAITAPMPGDILEVHVNAGDNVNPGDLICVLEAMKMRNMIRTSQTGVIATVDVSAGESVDYGATLVTFE